MNLVTAPWKLAVADASPGQATFRYGDSVITEAFDVPWDSHAIFIQQVLGWPTRTTTDTGTARLARVLPAEHPYYKYKYAVQASVVSRGFGGAPQPGDPVLSGPAGRREGVVGPYMAYKVARVNVTFSTLPYSILSDSETLHEWQRFVSWEFKPDSETITRRGRTFTFADGPSPPKGSNFPYDVRITAPQKGKLVVTWHQVPEAWIFNANGQAVQLQNAAGCVNANKWPAVGGGVSGFEAGTLLYDTFELTAETPPFPAVARGVLFNATPRTYRVALTFHYFNPPTNPAYPDYRGHNLMPPPPSASGTPSPYFYLATIGGTVTGATLYDYEDFDTIFYPA